MLSPEIRKMLEEEFKKQDGYSALGGLGGEHDDLLFKNITLKQYLEQEEKNNERNK